MTVKEIRYPKAERQLKELLTSNRVDVGYFEGVMHGDGLTVATIAGYNEVTRPFMSRAMEQSEKDIITKFQKELKKHNYNGSEAMKALGIFLVAQIRQQIMTSKSWAKPNAPSTIAKKGSSQPLIDTAKMLDSADYKVNR